MTQLVAKLLQKKEDEDAASPLVVELPGCSEWILSILPIKIAILSGILGSQYI